MADVLLIYPKAGHDVRGVSVNAPLALLTLAASLLPEFTVQIIDQRACDDFWGDLEHALKDKPLVAGITSMTGTQIYYGLEATKFIKERSETAVVWGGMHATIYSAQTAVKPYIDFVIRGEGELSFRSLVEQLARRGRSFEKIPGLVWKRDGRLYGTAQADPIDLATSPKLPWQLVNVEEYISPAQYLYDGVRRLLPFQGSRGCPFKCTFCSEPVLTKKYRMMPAQRVADECLEMAARYKLDHITFFDEEFFIHKRWAENVADAIGGRFSWWAQTRAADLLRVDLGKMERGGLLIVAPGLESGSNRMLKAMKKGETVEEYHKANAQLAQTKIFAQYNFIIGFPSETLAELNETVDLVLELLDTNKNAVVNQLSPLTPLPGTELLAQAVANYGFQEPDRLEDWIRVTRGRQEKPWLDAAALRRVRFLYYTSLFLCSAERYSQKFHIPAFVFTLYSKTIRLRWKRKWFWVDWEIPLLRLLFRWFINPVDYTFPDDYGDAFRAKESDILPATEKVSPLT